MGQKWPDYANLGKKWKNWCLTIFFKTNFLDVVFDVESESEIRFSKFVFFGEILAKNDPIMQIRQKMKKSIFDDFCQNQLPRRTFWRRIRTRNPFCEIFLRWRDIGKKWPNYAIGKKWKIDFWRFSSKPTSFLDVLFDTEHKSEICLTIFFFVGEILAKSDLIMQNKAKNETTSLDLIAFQYIGLDAVFAGIWTSNQKITSSHPTPPKLSNPARTLFRLRELSALSHRLVSDWLSSQNRSSTFTAVVRGGQNSHILPDANLLA